MTTDTEQTGNGYSAQEAREYEVSTYRLTCERDGYRCVLCGKTGIQVHEIVARSAFGKLRYKILFHPKNRVCLCPSCHEKAHTIEYRKTLLKLMMNKYRYVYEEKEFQRYL